jgi:predicted ATPase
MLTRLKVSGFKNLDGLDVHLGPFTCIAGANGVGKSNFFDAIHFLSALADKSLLEAAISVRGGDGRGGDVRNLFTRGGGESSDEMSFLVEMVIPATGESPLGQRAEAAATYLVYSLKLRYRSTEANRTLGGIELVHEDMAYIKRAEAAAQLGFRHSPKWRESVILGRRTSKFISTDDTEGSLRVRLHADAGAGSGGRPRSAPASGLPRTMLSTVTDASEHRTLVLARQEMMSWVQLQLEPSKLRAPDVFTAPHSVDATGGHLPATLYHLAQAASQVNADGAADIYMKVANRLGELIDDVDSIGVDVDNKRQALSILMTDRAGTAHLANALSDGTLRFLALAVMAVDPAPMALVCLEEPENGMHPKRIPAMLRLLKDLAVDVQEPVGPDNPFRQVIINTHSPSVVAEVEDDCLLVAVGSPGIVAGKRIARLDLRPLPSTWRDRVDPPIVTVAKGDLLDYLNPIRPHDVERDDEEGYASKAKQPGKRSRKVKNRDDMQLLLPTL